MKAVIFAGGVGTRLWPLSREKSPKQFEKLMGTSSTLQLSVKRLLPDFSYKDIYISTGKRYIGIVQKQLPDIPRENIIGEPEMRDVGPAVGLMTAILNRESPEEPFVILWSDHLVKREKLFRKIIKAAGLKISKEKDKIIFISQAPRFASENLGWIEYRRTVDSKDGIEFKEFLNFRYRPDKDLAKRFYQSGKHAWNLGYFVTTPKFLWKQFKQFVPNMYSILDSIAGKWGSKNFSTVLDKKYPSVENIHFDNAVLEKLNKSKAYVIVEDIGWSDVGTWEALKEALEDDPGQNVTKGKVLLTDCDDSLIYNFTDQTVAAIDVDEMLIVNTEDVILICQKESVPKIKKLVKSLAGTENEHLT